MSDRELTVLAIPTDAYCDPDTGVCTVPAEPTENVGFEAWVAGARAAAEADEQVVDRDSRAGGPHPATTTPGTGRART